MKGIYPKELSLTSDNAVLKAHYLDLDLDIVHDQIEYKLFDKRDAFGFSIVNFSDLSGNISSKQSYGVFVSTFETCFDHTQLVIDKMIKVSNEIC